MENKDSKSKTIKKNTKTSVTKKKNNTKKVTNTRENTTTKKVTNSKKNNTKMTNPTKQVKEQVKEVVKVEVSKEIIEEQPKVVIQEPVIEIPKKFKLEKKYILLSILSSILVFVCLISFFLVINPKMKEKIEIREFKSAINDLLEENNIEKIKDEIKKESMSGDRKELESKVENYLLNTLELKEKINVIKNDDKITKSLDLNNIGNEDVLKYYDSTLVSLDKNKEEINKVREVTNNIKFDNEELNDIYNELIEKINNNISFDEIDDLKNYIDKTKPVLNYLKNNKTSYKIDNKLIFIKRSKKEEYDKLVEQNKCDNCNYLKSYLVEDKEGPVITANNITITKGTKLNLSSKIGCYDKVDDKTDCVISGTYNSNKVGTYKITIKSTDKSNNTSVKTINVVVKEKQTVKKISTTGSSKRVNTNNKPYYIEVIRNQNVVIVYGLDSNKKEYNRIVKVFVASVGRNGKTPTGTFKTTKGLPWGALIGGVWGQYSTRITGSYLFHSVPYYSKNKGDLEWQEYNKLGTAASAGCVRMTVRDVKWIYDNISSGTTVRIYDGSLPKGVTKPSAQKIPSNSKNKGWDPTDPDPKNPWHKK